MTDVREIVVISIPRSGTNFFCECLGEFKDVLALFEIFNPAGVFGLNQSNMTSKFAQLANVDVNDARQAEIIEHFRERPITSLKLLRKAAKLAGYSRVSYKVFPKQLSNEALGDLLNGQNRAFVFVVRRRLDTFISYTKAKALKTWKMKDTTDFKKSSI